MRVKLGWLLIGVLLLAGCATTAPLPTRSTPAPAATTTTSQAATTTAPLAWEIPLANRFIHEPLVVSPSLVLVADDTGVIHALASDSGRSRWISQLSHPVNAIVGDARVVYGIGYAITRAINAGDGTTLWEHPLQGGSFALAPFETTPLIVNAEHGFTGFDALTGRLMWTVPVTGSMALCSQVGPRFYYVASGLLHAVDRTTGTEFWADAAGGCLFAAPEIPLVWTRIALTAHNASTGAVIWTRPGTVDAVIPVGTTIYILDADGLHALDAATGAELWGNRTIRDVALLEGDSATVYCYLRNGTLMALNQADGQLMWTQQLRAPTAAQPWRAVDKHYLYVQPDATFASPLTVVRRTDGSIVRTMTLPRLTTLPTFSMATNPQLGAEHLYVVYGTESGKGGVIAIDIPVP